MERVTLRFQSDNGGEYLYDDVTGGIFPWGTLEEAILKKELNGVLSDVEEGALRSASDQTLKERTHHLQTWRKEFGAFARTAHETFPVPGPDDIKPYVWNNPVELILIVTENCNLKCKYCCYASGDYTYHRKPTSRIMTYERAIKAVDWFAEGVSSRVARNPRKIYGLSFYGGEPLLNIKLIDAVLEYARKKYPGLFFPVLTTNGVLLHEENVKILEKHSVHVAVSIDGPEKEHDRLRVDLRERGTHSRIMANLAHIKKAHPDFWNHKMMSISVFDLVSDLDKNSQFFDDNVDVVPRSSFVNMVNGHNTHYYERFTKDDYNAFGNRVSFMREKYKDVMKKGGKPGTYLTALSGFSLITMVARPRVGDARPPFLPYTSCCVPGSRMTVNVDGEINMCERVNGTYPIGHLDHGGLDFQRVAELVQEYQKKIIYKCSKCPITHLCSNCFAFCETQCGVQERNGFCAESLREIRTNLKDYVSLMEADSNLEQAFKLKAMELMQEKIMFQS